jgi:two-component system, chemotaxis family, CheB/CheR fusion protein
MSYAPHAPPSLALAPAPPVEGDGDVRVVGIGCSAGGLEALGGFFRNVPSDSRLAFVVIQHLSPVHHSALPALLGRVTSLPVVEAEDGMHVLPGRVHVIPPGRDLSVTHGVLHLAAQVLSHGLRMPVDVFFCALAKDRRQAAIGVILSGMGSDGLLGLMAIKAEGGFTVVQDPQSAEADGMPHSAIQAGVADIVAEPQDMPGCIIDHLAQPLGAGPTMVRYRMNEPHALDEINLALREHCGNDFSLYKASTLLRRIERRMMVRQVSSLEDYVRLLRREPQEPELLFHEMLIGVTSFFRDPAVWDELRDKILPAMLARHPTGKAFRAWVPACSTGEEAYTLAMVFAEVARGFAPLPFSLQIFATDLDAEAVDAARKGLYGPEIVQAVSAERLAYFFTPEAPNKFRIRKQIRETVIFATQNIAVDPPFTRLDLLTCRNLLIYFEAKLQKQLLPLLHYALSPGGVLVLGSAETTGSFAHLFTPLNLKARIYSRDAQARTYDNLRFTDHRLAPLTAPIDPPSPDPTDTLGFLTDQLIQQTWAPAAVLVNASGDILYISGRTGKYLEPAVGKANINVHAMAREGLREPLAGVIHRAITSQQPVRLRGLRVGTNGGTQIVNVSVQALDKPEPLRGKVILVFEDVAMPRRRRKLADDATQELSLRDELQQTREALQATHEAMQTTVEELRSSNEELQSTNEELQSTNEELTTSKEEVQSVNEELQTVNAELQSKVEDLTWVKNDMANLLNSTEIATIFLDGQLNVRRFTTHALRLFRLIDSDVGRPLAHVVTDLECPSLSADAGEVLATLVFKESVAMTGDGRWYRVRVMPYRTQDNLIDGVVITFTDVTAIKKLEAELRLHGT